MSTRPSPKKPLGPITVALPLVWIGAEETDITFVNSIAVQPQGDEVIILFGQQSPPLLFGEPADIAKKARELKHVPVKMAIRLGTTRARLAEFADVLQRSVAAMEEFDKVTAAARKARSKTQPRARKAPARPKRR